MYHLHNVIPTTAASSGKFPYNTSFSHRANPQWNLPKIILNVSLVEANLPQLVDMSRVGYN